ncbi:MAG: hypothetical protein C0485_12105 [Pirellula sp.]|nr:hypothetical protein [Pirellula sp.]
MASLSTGKDGKRKGLHRVLLTDANGKRQQLYLGRIPKKDAEAVRRAVTELERSAQYGHTAADFALAWLSEAGDDIHGKLVKFGLAKDRAVSAPAEVLTLGRLVEMYQSRPGWRALKSGTQRVQSRALQFALVHFDATTPVEKITAAAAMDFYAALQLDRGDGGMGQAVSTANTISSVISGAFNYGIDAEVLVRNPFRKLPSGTRRGNNAMVSLADTLKVFEALQTNEDKLAFGMARWGAVRVISEIRTLKWTDVDWAKRKILIHSPKTERHEGHAERWIPIFAELAPLLEARFDECEAGEGVLPSYQNSDKAKLRDMLRNAIKRAGVERWPRLWHSLRATRQSELADRFPSHLVHRWVGNSKDVGEKHYLMMSDEHFIQAATQNATQSVSDTARQDKTRENSGA